MPKRSQPEPSVRILKCGPYLVTALPLDVVEIMTDDDGYALTYRRVRRLKTPPSYSLCRCGKTRSHPFCDGSHTKARFRGTEHPEAHTPFRKMAKTYPGPVLSLRDAERLCANAGFCSRKEGTWEAVRRSDEPRMYRMALQQTFDCCAGRLELFDSRTGELIEKTFRKSVSLVEDPGDGSSGPVWLKGGILLIGADGRPYEVRNRMSLCRCGASRFKPFCDGSHSRVRFKARYRIPGR